MFFQRLQHVVAGIALLGMLGASQGAMATMSSNNSNSNPTHSLLDALELHQQGWGQLGRDVAAHAAESEALSLRIADQDYAHGLGVHAPSEIVFSLEGRYLRFEAEVGVQWQEGGPGSVVFEIYVDEERVYQSELMTETTPAEPIAIDLQGADTLRLVVTDGSDGITNDAANWAAARLLPNPDAEALHITPVDIAVFGQVITSDPARKAGIRASRLEEVAGEDLYLDAQVLPDDNGQYAVPMHDGVASIGLSWVERRRVATLGLDLAPEAIVPSADQVSLEFWEVPRHGVTPGGAPWQGAWVALPGNLEIEDHKLRFTPEWGDLPERTDGVYKYRWLIEDQEAPLQVADLQAISSNRWAHDAFTFQLDPEAAPAPVSVELYNGFFATTEEADSDAPRSMGLDALETTVDIHHCRPGVWRIADRTVLRFRTGSEAIAIGLDDVIREGVVYVPHAGILVKAADNEADIASQQALIAANSRIRERVAEMPEQSLTQAIEFAHRNEGDLGPTMLSLANGNHKFVLERNGTLRFEPDREAANLYETGLNQAYPLTVQPVIEGADLGHADIQRQFLHQDGHWYPVADIHFPHGDLEVVQRSYVAPLDAPGNATPAWKSEAPLGVMELTLYNHGDERDVLTMHLAFQYNNSTEALRVTETDGNWLLYWQETPVARLSLPDAATGEHLTIRVTDAQQLEISATLDPGAALPLQLLLPRWTLDAEALLALSTDRDYLQQAVAHWDAVMDDTMTARLPDQNLEDIMRASIIHCLLATRNEDYARLAPWIASIYYGPLESESNSIIRGLAYWGHDDFTMRALDYFITRYHEDGYLTTGYTTMGTGWHLWSVGEYIKLSRDLDWLAENADELLRVAQWMMAQVEKTQVYDAVGNPVPEFGLAPPGPAADWESFQYYFYINGYYYVGLEAIADALAYLEHPEESSIREATAALQGHILDAFRYAQERAPVVQLKNGAWVPFNPAHPYAWGLLEDLYRGQDVGRSWAYDVELGSHHLVPMGVLDPFARETEWMLDHMEDVQFLKSGWMYYPQEENEADWFNLGGFAKVQPYYARNHDIYAMRQEPKLFLRAYFNSIASLLNREDLSLWEHFFNGAYNKTHETGYLVYQSRIMLLMENQGGLWVAPFIPQDWFIQDKPVVVENAPTEWGAVGYRIQPNPAEETITLEVDLTAMKEMPEALYLPLRLPEDYRIQDIRADRDIATAWNAEAQQLTMTPTSPDHYTITISYDTP